MLEKQIVPWTTACWSVVASAVYDIHYQVLRNRWPINVVICVTGLYERTTKTERDREKVTSISRIEQRNCLWPLAHAPSNRQLNFSHIFLKIVCVEQN